MNIALTIISVLAIFMPGGPHFIAHRPAPIVVVQREEHPVIQTMPPRFRLTSNTVYQGTTTTIPTVCACPASAIAFDSLDGTFFFSEDGYVAKATVQGAVTNIGQVSGFGNNVGGLAFNPITNTLYASDAFGCTVDAIDSSYNITILAGAGGGHVCGTADGSGSAARFQSPTGMVFDGIHNVLFVADANTVRSVTPSGMVTTLTQTGIVGFGPEGLTLDPTTGNLYITNPVQNTILKVTQSGGVSVLTGRSLTGHYQEDGPPSKALLDQPSSIVFNQADRKLYITDSDNNQIRQIDLTGVVRTIAGDGRQGYQDGAGITAEFFTPIGITIDPATRLLYVAENGFHGNVRTVTTSGAVPPPPPHGVAILNLATIPNGVMGAAGAPDGSFWFTESTGNKIGRVFPSGRISELPLPGGFTSPTDMTLGGDGNIWFDDGPFNSFQTIINDIAKILPTGRIFEYSIAQQVSPFSIAAALTLGPDKNVWFTDPNNSAIGFVTPTGIMQEVIVNSPTSIATGFDGDLWTTSQQNGVWEVDRNTPDGTIIARYVFPSDGALSSITRGPDGRMWSIARSGLALVALTKNGKATFYPIPPVPGCGAQRLNLPDVTRSGFPSCPRAPSALTTGPDGALWMAIGDQIFTQGAIARMTVSGVYIQFDVPTPHSLPSHIAFGKGGVVWFTDKGANKIGHLY